MAERSALQLVPGGYPPHSHQCPVCLGGWMCADEECCDEQGYRSALRSKPCTYCSRKPGKMDKPCAHSPHRWRHEVYFDAPRYVCIHCEATSLVQPSRSRAMMPSAEQCPTCKRPRSLSQDLFCDECEER